MAFPNVYNNFVTVLTADHEIGSGTLKISPSATALLGTVLSGSPAWLTVVRRDALVNGQVADPTYMTIFSVDAIVGGELIIDATLDDTVDQAFSRGDYVAVNDTAGLFRLIFTSLEALEAGSGVFIGGPIGGGPVDGRVLVVGTGGVLDQVASIAQSRVTNLVTDLAAKAPLASPTFTGDVTTTGIINANGGLFFPATTTISMANGSTIAASANGNTFVQLQTLTLYMSGAQVVRIGLLGGNELHLEGSTFTVSVNQAVTGAMLVGMASAGASAAQLEVKAKDSSTPVFAGYVSTGGSARFLVDATGLTTFALSPSSPGVGANSQQWGTGTTSTAIQATTLGSNASAPNTNATSFGYAAVASGAGSISVGAATTASNANSIAIGVTVTCSGANAVSIGVSSSATASNAVAVGPVAVAGFAGSVAIGYGSTTTAANQFIAGSSAVQIDAVYFGKGVTDASPVAYTIHGTGGSGANVAGADIKIAGGRSTGTGAGGSVVLQVAPAGSTGSSLNALVDRLTIDSTGLCTIAGNMAATGTVTTGGGLRVNTDGTPFLIDGETVSGFAGFWPGLNPPDALNFAFLVSNLALFTAVNSATGGVTQIRCGGTTCIVVSDASTATVPRAIIGYQPAGTDGDPLASLSVIALNSSYRALALEGRLNQLEPLLPLRGRTDTNTRHDMAFVDAVWSVATNGSQLGELVLSSTGYNSTHIGMSFRDTGAISQPIIPIANVRDAADDAAAAALTPAVPVGGIYRTGSVVKIRVA